MAAGDKNAKSRMSVKLTAGNEKYDQVIALSQGNINESLKYHFRTNKDLCNFNAQIKEPIIGKLSGKLKPPTIELVDIDAADQGVYIIEFERGSTFTTTSVTMDEATSMPVMVNKKLDASGWKIAFYIDFSLKAMTRVGAHVKDDIAKLVNNPGVYTVEQLLIDFGTADLMSFNWDRSEIPGPRTEIPEVTIKQFVNQWLAVTRQNPDAAKHQVIGYAVKANDAQAANPMAPSLPPTSVRLQTIAYRDAETRPSPSHDYNAFLFTEMTENRKMITKDLDWSGNFFYDSIGGTLIMSRELFMHRYLAPKLKLFNRGSLRTGMDIITRLIFKTWGSSIKVPIDETISTEWSKGSHDLELLWVHHSLKETESVAYWFNHYSKLEIKPASNVFLLTQKIAAEFEDRKQKVLPRTAVELNNVIEFKLSSIPKTGQLDIDVTSTSPEIRTNYEYGIEGYSDEARKWLMTMFGDKGPSFQLVTDFLQTEIPARTNEIKAALNDQARFVFPGGGTFDMKDPMFNDVGDLMIGLTYRSGE